MTLATFTVVCKAKREGDKFIIEGLATLIDILNGGK